MRLPSDMPRRRAGEGAGLAFLIILICEIPLGLLGGCVFSLLWRWFVMPVADLPPLGVLEAWGLALAVGYVTMTVPKPSEEDPVTGAVTLVLTLALKALVALAVGFFLALALGRV